MKQLLVLFLLISISFSSLVWEFDTEGSVSIKPVVYQGAIVTASDDGNIYSLDAVSGARKWSTSVGIVPNEVFVFDNAVVSSTTSAKLTKLGAGGKVAWQVDFNTTDYNASRIYGASANDKDIFVTADSGVYKVSKAGTVTTLVSFEDIKEEQILTAPASGSGFVIYGNDNELIKISESGQTLWKTSISGGKYWLSRPIVSGDVVYIGALDSKMHAYRVSTGLKHWEVQSRNWILGSAVVDSNTAYFGSNDGRIYAVDSNGRILWEAKTQLAIKSQPELGRMGGIDVVFVGAGDRNIYAISRENGDILWSGPSAGAVGSPLFYLNSVIFGSGDSNIYSYSTERACSLTNPMEGDLIGLKEVVVNGNYVSESGNAAVWVSINNGEWKEAETGESNWIYYLDPSENFNMGLNTIFCMVSDGSGQESGPTFTEVTINHDPNAALSDLKIRVPPSIIEGEEFTIYVNDGDDGSPVERFTWTLNSGEGKQSGKNITLTLNEPSSHSITVKKIGFNDKTVKFTVNESGVNPFILAGGVLVIIIVLWQVWTRFLKQRFAKKKKR
ncbi:PQQ-binding-like beta-propeller repeat protein [Candidatus Micrarchaeota archaeon]|nr:PQQ-binding-like beta-propeller repeat protein [Candidatus Micrarchaeota archaeon]